MVAVVRVAPRCRTTITVFPLQKHCEVPDIDGLSRPHRPGCPEERRKEIGGRDRCRTQHTPVPVTGCYPRGQGPYLLAPAQRVVADVGDESTPRGTDPAAQGRSATSYGTPFRNHPIRMTLVCRRPLWR